MEPSDPLNVPDSPNAGEPVKTGPLRGLSADDLITLNEEIAGMARAGLPLDQGLAALAKEMGRGRLQKVTATLAADLQAGHTLPQALDRQAGAVPPFYAGLVAAGIRTGRIGEVLATLTIYSRTLADLRNTVLGALIYPAVVLVLAFILFCFVFFGVVPQYEKIFSDFRMKLPVLTEAMFWISRHLLEVAVLPPLVIAIGLIVARLYMGGTLAGRRRWARFVYAVPIVGTLVRTARLAAFTDLLGILIDHALPLPEAFLLAGAASSDPIMADAAADVNRDLSQGMTLGESLHQRKLVPELMSWMAAIGEQRGTLGKSLHHVADMYRRQAEMRAVLLRNLLPPLLIILTAGILIVLFIFALTLPLMSLLEGLSGS